MIYVHRKKLPDRSKDLNHSIGQMLSSYTRAVQNQMKIEGSLFQQRTKAICLSRNVKIASAFYGKEFGMVFDSCLEDFSFPHICFDCIHNHPVQNGLVEIPEDWEFSSCRDYYFERGGRLIDCKLADRELGIVRV
jgi:putative transposase